MYERNKQMPRELVDRTMSDTYSQTVIPDMPRWSGFCAALLRSHPLMVYSAFVTVSLLLLGSMAVASLPS